MIIVKLFSALVLLDLALALANDEQENRALGVQPKPSWRYVPLNSLTLGDIMGNSGSNDSDIETNKPRPEQWWHFLKQKDSVKGSLFSSVSLVNSTNRIKPGLINRLAQKPTVIRPKPAKFSVLLSKFRKTPAPLTHPTVPNLKYSPDVQLNQEQEPEKPAEPVVAMVEEELGEEEDEVEEQQDVRVNVVKTSSLRQSMVKPTTQEEYNTKIPFPVFLKEIASASNPTDMPDTPMTTCVGEDCLSYSSSLLTTSSTPPSTTPTEPEPEADTTTTIEYSPPPTIMTTTTTLRVRKPSPATQSAPLVPKKEEDTTKTDLIQFLKDKLTVLIATNRRILSTIQSQSRLQREILAVLSDFKDGL